MESQKNILYGGDLPGDFYHGCKSFGEFIVERLTLLKDSPVLVNGVTEEVITAASLLKSVHLMTDVFGHHGLQEGDVVSICSENCNEFPMILFGSFCQGMTVAPLNVTYSEEEIHHAINLSKPKIIFAAPTTVEKILNVAKRNSFVRKVVTFNTHADKSITTFHDYVNDKSVKRSPKLTCKPLDCKENVSLILCSSGTTGLPKGVQLTQHNLIVAAAQSVVKIANNKAVIEDDLVFLGVIPWFHAFGCLTLITIILGDAKLVFLPKFQEKQFLQAIETHKILAAFLVPPLMVFLAKHPLVDQYDLTSLKLLTCGAAPLSKETEDAVYERLGVFAIRQGYGMSETTLSVLTQNMEACKPGSVGVLDMGVYGKVIDPDTGRLMSANERGELCFKGHCIMKGYVGDKKATEGTIDAEGWLHTGDIGYFDEDGEWFIVDRIKELIKYKAYQVPPAEIEAVLLTHDRIQDAAVIGKPDESAGELPLAFVVKMNPDLTERDVIDFVDGKVSPAKRLRGGVIFVDEIPKNPSGKILRRVLRDRLKNLKPKL